MIFEQLAKKEGEVFLNGLHQEYGAMINERAPFTLQLLEAKYPHFHILLKQMACYDCRDRSKTTEFAKTIAKSLSGDDFYSFVASLILLRFKTQENITLVLRNSNYFVYILMNQLFSKFTLFVNLEKREEVEELRALILRLKNSTDIVDCYKLKLIVTQTLNRPEFMVFLPLYHEFFASSNRSPEEKKRVFFSVLSWALVESSLPHKLSRNAQELLDMSFTLRELRNELWRSLPLERKLDDALETYSPPTLSLNSLAFLYFHFIEVTLQNINGPKNFLHQFHTQREITGNKLGKFVESVSTTKDKTDKEDPVQSIEKLSLNGI